MLQTALYYGHFDSTDTLLLRSPPILRHPVITFTPIIQTPRYYGQLLIPTSHYYGNPNNGYHVSTPIVRIPRCYGHPDNTDTQLLRTVFSLISVTGRVRLAGHEFNFEFL